jgi:LysM repeat protein
MKKQLNHLRRFFARTGARKLNAATAREVIPASYDDDDNSNRLSGAFIVVLALHVIALVGVFTFSRMKDPKPGKLPNPAAQGANVADLPATGSGSVTNAPAPAGAVPAAAPAPQDPPQYASLQPAKHAVPSATDSPADSTDAAKPTTRGGGRTYIVKNGDNLTKIAVAWGVRPADLMAANNLKSDDIKPGQELTIPDAKSARPITEQKPVTKAPEKASAAKVNASSYTVRKNDTLVKIARDLGVRYDDLTKINGIKDPRKLQEGQVLKVPKKS